VSEGPGRPTRILFVDDNSDDVVLELAELEQTLERIEHRTVETGPELRAALEEEPWDAIICDYWMPELSGLDALRAAKALAPTTPFFLVSGTVGEEVAVDAMRAGADDYVLKRNLTRLATAVQREIRGAEQRTAAALSDKGLRLLADVGAALAATLQRRTVVSEVPPLVVLSFGDVCAIDLLDESGAAFRAAVAHAEPAEAKRLAHLDAAHPPRWTQPGANPWAQVGRTSVPSDHLDEAGGEIEGGFAELARALALTAAITIPLYSKERLAGALHIARRRPYTTLEARILEDLAGRITMALENAFLFERAQRAVQIRDEFLSIASHELRTPLTSLQLQIQGLRELAEKKRGEWTDERLFRRLDRSVRSLDRLGQLVEGLLDVTRIADNRLRLDLAELDLRALAAGVVDRFQDEATHAGCALTLLPGPPVTAELDGLRVDQALTNLIGNALKYGPGKPVLVSIGEAGPRAVVTVEDHGIGIPAGDLERIFGRFERGVSSRHYGGLGLGLFITQRIVEAHHGSVVAENLPGGGAVFVMSLPRTPPAAAESTAPGDGEASSSAPAVPREPGEHAVYMVDPDGQVLTWNEGAREIHGPGAGEVLGQSFARFFNERDRAQGKPDRLLETAAAAGRAEDEGWRVRRDGSLFWAHADITAVHDALGRLRGHVILTRDLSRKPRADIVLRQWEERLRRLVESVEDYGIVLLDEQGRIASWNGAAERLTGYRADEILGEPLARLHTPEAIAAGQPAQELGRAGAEGRLETVDRRVRKGGERFRAQSLLTAIHDPDSGAPRGYATVIRDLGTQPSEDEPAPRSALLGELGALHRIASELRRGYTPSVDGDQSLASQLDGALRQLEQVTGFGEALAVASPGLQLGAIQREAADLAAIVGRVVSDLRSPAEKLGSQLILRAPPTLVGAWDGARIARVIVTLLSNAVRFGDCKPVEIELRQEGGLAHLEVRDHGLGIPPEQLADVFTRFERASHDRHDRAGGLGLHLTKTIVLAHGGSIRVASRPREGTRFSVELPMRPATP
jgi:PAS domain S-box-containing protein